jgi:hypothetical protein
LCNPRWEGPRRELQKMKYEVFCRGHFYAKRKKRVFTIFAGVCKFIDCLPDFLRLSLRIDVSLAKFDGDVIDEGKFQ